jgi:hypothetical protein
MLKRVLCLLVVASFIRLSNANAGFIAGWDFQTTATGGTAAAVAPGMPNRLNANFGSGSLFLDGSNGSDAWVTTTNGNELTSFAGTTNVNVGSGFSTSNAGASSLSLQNSSANGKSITFSFSMTNMQGLEVSYATQRSGSGFTSHLWQSSIDGINWSNVETVSSIPSSYGLVKLATISSLDNLQTAFLRTTFTGATASNGNNRLDNIQLNSITAVPEPSSIVLFCIMGCYGIASSFRRHMAKSKRS